MPSEKLVNQLRDELDRRVADLSDGDPEAAGLVLEALANLWAAGVHAYDLPSLPLAVSMVDRAVAELEGLLDGAGREVEWARSALVQLGNEEALHVHRAAVLVALETRHWVWARTTGAALLDGRADVWAAKEAELAHAFDEQVRPWAWLLNALVGDAGLREGNLLMVAEDRRRPLWWWWEGVDVPVDVLTRLVSASEVIVPWPTAQRVFDTFVHAARTWAYAVETLKNKEEPVH